MELANLRAANNGVGVDRLCAVLRSLLVRQEGGVASRGKGAEDAVSNMVPGVVIAIEAEEGNDCSQNLQDTTESMHAHAGPNSCMQRKAIRPPGTQKVSSTTPPVILVLPPPPVAVLLSRSRHGPGSLYCCIEGSGSGSFQMYYG